MWLLMTIVLGVALGILLAAGEVQTAKFRNARFEMPTRASEPNYRIPPISLTQSMTVSGVLLGRVRLFSNC